MTEDEITAYAQKFSWICAVCNYALIREEESKWSCFHCSEIAKLSAERDMWKERFESKERLYQLLNRLPGL